MCNYNNGKIYKLYNTITDDIYIGATTLTLSERMQRHISASKDIKKDKSKLYKHFKEHGKEHFFIELLDVYNCSSKNELYAKEGEYIRALTPALNTRIEGRTRRQRGEDNKDAVKAYHTQYYADNIAVISARKKQSYYNNWDTIKEKRTLKYADSKDTFKERVKKYYDANTYKICEQKKQYYNFNKERKQQENTKTV